MARLEIEHIIPRINFAADDPAADNELNLWLACPICNGHKDTKAIKLQALIPKPETLYLCLIRALKIGSGIFAGLMMVFRSSV